MEKQDTDNNFHVRRNTDAWRHKGDRTSAGLEGGKASTLREAYQKHYPVTRDSELMGAVERLPYRDLVDLYTYIRDLLGEKRRRMS